VEKRLDIQSIFLLVLLSAIWGVTFPAMKIALQGFPPILLGGFRFILAGIIVTFFAILRKERFIAHSRGSRFLLTFYALALALQIILLLIGIQYTSANRCAIFFNTAPFWVLLLAIFFLPYENLTLNKWIGAALAFIGIAVMFVGREGNNTRDSLLGDVLVLGAAVTWGVRIIVLKYFPKTVGIMTIQVWQFSIAGFLLTVLGFSMEKVSEIHLDFSVVAAFLYLAIMSNVAGFLLWTHLVQKEVATRVSPFMFLTPVFGVLASAALLKEVITGYLLAGLFLVGSGIHIVNRQTSAKKANNKRKANIQGSQLG